MAAKGHNRIGITLAITSGLLGIILSAIRPAAAYVTEGPVWVGGTVSFAYAVPGNSGKWASALQDAMTIWNSTSSFTFNPVNQTVDPCDLTAMPGAAFGTAACDMSFGSSTLAITLYNYNGQKQFTHAGTVFNSAKTFDVYHGAEKYNPEDFRRVAVHELGHVLGLGHQTDTTISAIMAPIIGDIEQPTSDDISGVSALYPSVSKPVSLLSIVSAVLPASRSVQNGVTATVFATIINTGSQTATSCSIAMANSTTAAGLSYQTTNSGNNTSTGAANQPVDIPAGGSQSFIIAVTPSATFDPTNLAFTMSCANSSSAPSTIGLNTLLLSSSSGPTPDIVTLAASASSDGYVHISGGSGAFVVATVNVGISGSLVASADTGSTTLPVTLNLCQTNPRTGACISPLGPSVTVTIGPNETPTFAIFAGSQSAIAPDPANKRIFVRFKDAATGTTRGATSIAVTTN